MERRGGGGRARGDRGDKRREEKNIIICNGVEWSKDRTQAAESIKWRPQQAYGSNQVLLAQPQTIFSTHKILTSLFLMSSDVS